MAHVSSNRVDSGLIRAIAESLRETGSAIQQDPEGHGASLRHTVQSLQELLREHDDPHLMYLSYFLGLYVDDVWCNIAMDATSQSEISDDSVRAILSSIGEKFVVLAEHLSRANYQKCYGVYVDLVHSYLCWVNNIKKETEALI